MAVSAVAGFNLGEKTGLSLWCGFPPNNVNVYILGTSRFTALVDLLVGEREEQKSAFAGKRRFLQMREPTYIRRPRLYFFFENLLV